MVFGDFNQILGQSEKSGGNPMTYTQVQGFQEALQINELLNLGFVGHAFAWTNGQANDSNIQERLDRAVATIDWKEAFPKAVVQHLQRYKSDHCPILVDILGESMKKHRKPHIYRFEEVWLQNLECEKVIENIWQEN